MNNVIHHFFKLLVVLVLLGAPTFYANVFAQHACGTQATTEDVEYMRKHIDHLAQHPEKMRTTTTTTYVPIKAHIIRSSTGGGGLSIPELLDAFDIVNTYYANANIKFFFYEGINFIDNDQYYDYKAIDEKALASAHEVPNVINIYFARTVTSASGSSLCGYAYFPASNKDRIFMNNGCTNNGSTLTHELGHYLTLYHTHGTTNTGTTDELVDGSNCTTAGDRVCDTPADPNLSGKVDESCAYTNKNEDGSVPKDANGQEYSPNPRNIMSYSRSNCRNVLTTGQYDRIKSGLSVGRDYLLTQAQFGPSIASFTPTTGTLGTTMTITGTGFSANAGENIVTVGGVTIPVTASTSTQLTLDLPSEIKSGLVTVRVGQQISYSKGSFLIQVTTFPYNESFESGIGDWSQNQDDDFNWTSNFGSTPSGTTGPSAAIDGNAYLYVESSSPNYPSKVARLTSASFDLSQLTTPKLSFAYHMYGSDMGTLDLQISTDNGTNWVSLWQKTGDQTNAWFNQTVDLDGYKTNTVLFRFVGTTGTDFSGDMAIDRIQVNNTGVIRLTSFSPTQTLIGQTVTITGEGFSTTLGNNVVKINGVRATVTSATATELKVTVPVGASTGSITVEIEGQVISSVTPLIIPLTDFPYNESFENGSGIWTQSSTDDFDWGLNVGGTNSSSTGPSAAINGSNYLYIESSDPNSPTKTAIISSAYFNLASLTNPKFNFSYHMYGSNMGTLKLEASTNGTSWTSLWEQTGDKGNQWLAASVDLSAYQSANVQFRFVGVTGNGFRSDMAIDKLNIKGDDVLTLSNFSPASGAAKSLVTIAGANFDPTAANNVVKFNGVTATITQAAAGQLSVLVPTGATTGKITIEVGGVTVTSATNFTLATSAASAPTITNVSPNSGRVGDEVTITGTNFDPTAANNMVKFNGTVATVTSATVTELKVTIPTGAFTGKITVEVNNLAAVSTNNFVVIYPLAITGFSPERGREGDEITITGTNFDPTTANNTVKFNGTTATVSAATEIELKVKVPTGATTGKVTIDANGESVTSTNDFTVIGAHAITGFSPKSGKAGDEITITGVNFSTTATDHAVMLNGATARVTSATTNELKIIVPAGATAGSRRISITLFGLLALSPDNFTVIAPPVITDFLPKSGKAGDQIRVFGNGFGIFSDQVVVKFNGVVAQVNSVNGSVASVIVPEGASTGKITIEVNGLSGTSSQDFVISSVSGLSAQLSSQLTVYPNPVYDLLRIRLDGKAAQKIRLTLYNLQGQEILQGTQKFKNNEAVFNLAGVNAGEYILMMTVGDKVATRRITKK